MFDLILFAVENRESVNNGLSIVSICLYLWLYLPCGSAINHFVATAAVSVRHGAVPFTLL